MRHDEFKIGAEFRLGDKVYRCTDTGTRTVSVIRIDSVKVAGTHPKMLNREEAERDGWFNGPPYAVQEIVFDEDDMPACETV